MLTEKFKANNNMAQYLDILIVETALEKSCKNATVWVGKDTGHIGGQK